MPLRILIVEDEALVAADLDVILEDAGHHVVGVAADMIAALEIAKSEDLDAALLDIGLAAGTNGVRTAQLLRERHGVPSLFVSGRINNDLRDRMATLEPIGFVSKPFGAHEILAALDRLDRGV